MITRAKKTITEVRKETRFGYSVVARFIKVEYPQGGIAYELQKHEDWGDHITYPRDSFREFRSKEEGNQVYKLYTKNDGYRFTSKVEFEETDTSSLN